MKLGELTEINTFIIYFILIITILWILLIIFTHTDI